MFASSRRGFFKLLVTALGGAVVLLKAGSALAKKLAVKLDQVPALKQVGGAVILKLGGKDVMLIRDSASSVRALSPVCTHQACYLGYNKKTRRLDCPCHKSSYDLNGKVLGGPAPKNLQVYTAELDGDRVIVSVG
jgi:Rieske Fe-S protein